MMSFNKKIPIVIFISMFVLGGLFIVDQRQQALVIQFGEVIKTINEPGLHFKIPLIQDVKYFEKRILNVAALEREVLANDQKRIIISTYAKYKITDPLKFYQTVRDERGANSRLIGAIESSMRQVIGEHPLSSLLTGQRTEIMKIISERVNSQASKSGIEVVDVRISRADLPKENSAAIYSSMQTEREKEAKEFRAQGNEEALKIKSEANKESQRIISDSKKQSEIIRGEGEAKAHQIMANAINQDLDFFTFYNSLKAYKNSMKGSNTTFVMTPDSPFLKYFKTSN